MNKKADIVFCEDCYYSEWGYNGFGMKTLWCNNHKKTRGHSPIAFGWEEEVRKWKPITIPGWCPIVKKHKNPSVTYRIRARLKR